MGDEPGNGMSDLRKIPGVGADMERYLQNIGIRCVADLVGQDPEELYHKDCLKKGFQERGCQFYLESPTNQQFIIKWWYWKDKAYPEDSGNGPEYS